MQRIKIILLVLVGAGLVQGQIQTGGLTSSSGSAINFSSSSHTTPEIVVANVGALPATCTTGETAFVTAATAGKQGYKCSGTNTWTQDTGVASGLGTCSLMAAGANTVSVDNGSGCPIDSTVTIVSGAISASGSVSSGVGSGVAGAYVEAAGTLPAIVSNSVMTVAPTSVTGYQVVWPSLAATGIPLWTNSSNTVTESVLTGSTAGDLYYWNGSTFTRFAGNSSGTQCFQENSSGVPAWGTCGGTAALSSITAATGANTIASGNNGAQIWNWAQTSNNQSAFTIGETTAATGGTLGNQYGLKVVGLAGSTAVPLGVIGSLTGSQTLPTFHITPTWNTTGVVDAALLINVTNTASGAASKIVDYQIGGTSQWNVDKAGNTIQLGSGSFGSSPPTCMAGTGGVWCAGEGTAASGASGMDLFYADSTAHRWKMINNNGTAVNVSGAGDASTVQFCGTTTTCSHTAQTSAQIVYGSAAMVSGTPSTYTVTGISPAFTSSSTYVCTIAGTTAPTTSLYSVANVSGSSFTVTGPATDTNVVNYICVGT